MIKKFSFTKCGSSRYFYQVLWQFLKSWRSRSNFGGLAVAAFGGEMRSNYFKNTANGINQYYATWVASSIGRAGAS